MVSTISALTSSLCSRLKGESDTASLDAQVLLAFVLGKSRSWILAHTEECLSVEQVEAFNSLAARLEMGEPLPYLLQQWEFYGCSFRVTPDVLIPRPETELLVEEALAWLRKHPLQRFVVDVGTGSGIIAISLALQIPDLRLIASDLSQPALKVAYQNVQAHKVLAQVDLVCCDLLPPVTSRFDLICANLPYIATPVLETLNVTRWEPSLALDGGPHGVMLISRLLEQSQTCLNPGGRLLFEIEATQGDAVLSVARHFFPEAEIRVMLDLTGRERLLSVQLVA